MITIIAKDDDNDYNIKTKKKKLLCFFEATESEIHCLWKLLPESPVKLIKARPDSIKLRLNSCLESGLC